MSGDAPGPDADDTLLDDLRVTVAAFDSVPDRLVEAAKSAYVWRTIDEELAQLQFDSLASPEALVRSTQAAVHLTFGTSQAWIEVDLTSEYIMGQVIPPATEIKLIFASDEDVTAACDEVGQFSFDRPTSGPVRLIARLAEGEVATEWFTI